MTNVLCCPVSWSIGRLDSCWEDLARHRNKRHLKQRRRRWGGEQQRKRSRLWGRCMIIRCLRSLVFSSDKWTNSTAHIWHRFQGKPAVNLVVNSFVVVLFSSVGIPALLDVEDMVRLSKPEPRSVQCYVQMIFSKYRPKDLDMSNLIIAWNGSLCVLF